MDIRTLFFYGSVITTLLCLCGCSDTNNSYTEVDGLAPIISLTKGTTLMIEPDMNFTLSAVVVDHDGLRSIRLKNSDIHLDKVIDLTHKEEIVYTYELAYQFKILSSVNGDIFPIVITATDLGGRMTEETITINLNGDLTQPKFEFVPDIRNYILIENGETTSSYELKFKTTDNKAFSAVYITITNQEDKTEFYTETVTNFTGSGNLLEYNKTITFPATPVNYLLTIRAVDKFDNEVIHVSELIVTDLPDFNYMYLADVATDAELTADVYGVPMLINHTGVYEYTAYYYSETAGTKIRFIPQKTAFTPICFGLDPSDKSVLIKSATADPITLPSVGYYKITFNIQTGAYKVETYKPKDAPVAIGEERYISDKPNEGTYKLKLCLAGVGFTGVDNWSTSNGINLNQSSTNPYLFSAEIPLTAGASIEFTISPYHPWGWWPEPFWRFSADKNIGYDANVLNGGDNYSVKVPVTGKYRFTFDTHLLRSKLYPIH